MDLLTFSLDNIFLLLQQMSVFLVIAYLFTKTPAFRSFRVESLAERHMLSLYLIFSVFSILGTYFGLPIQDAIANTRAIGAVLAGLVGGPKLGLAVGFTAGLHRYTLGGFTAFSCGVSTTAEGLIGGLVHLYLVRNHRQTLLLSPQVAFFTTFCSEITQMMIILGLARPFSEALALVEVIALPMILANSAGAAIFVSIIRDQQRTYDELSVLFSAKAMRIAERTLTILGKGFPEHGAEELAQIVHEETGVGAVAITDREKVLAFTGIGADHHRAGQMLTSPHIIKSIEENRIVYADGIKRSWKCALSTDCPLGSALSIPIRVDSDLIGTINLFETKDTIFLGLNKTLGEGIANLISDQILHARYNEQKNLLVQSELKLVQAQINPHFLFNALNTIIAVIRKDSHQARELLLHLSNFFRKNLKRTTDISTLAEELDHVQSYLKIEKARFGDQLTLEMDIDNNLLALRLPVFSLQPLIENAIKHGISQMFAPGIVRISAHRHDANVVIKIEDNGGNYQEGGPIGLGMNIVEKRIKSLYGETYGVEVTCEPQVRTLISITLPY
ncbi:sensor histidine kinase [Desulfobulbus rhabdoformis]|nr:sensor histidine kinase [Desulfobulbus rhabdoformis]MBM9614778.1 sensor histidine kinase [Desulfobulbus rhabdoformis]